MRGRDGGSGGVVGREGNACMARIACAEREREAR